MLCYNEADTEAAAQAAQATHGSKGKVRLFIGVLSSAARRRHRNAIRATWAADKRLYRCALCGTPAAGCKQRLSLTLPLARVVFVVAKPRDPALFEAMQEEAAATGDMAVLPGIWEGYHNITHQTLEVFRLAAIMPDVTHVAKASPVSLAAAAAHRVGK